MPDTSGVLDLSGLRQTLNRVASRLDALENSGGGGGEGGLSSAQVESLISSALGDYDTSTEVTTKINSALGDYDTSSEVNNKISSALESAGGGGGLSEAQVQDLINNALRLNGLQEYIDVGGDNEVDAAVLRGIRQTISDLTGIELDVSDAGLPTLADNMRLALNTIEGLDEDRQSVVSWSPSATIDGDKFASIAIGRGDGGPITIADNAFWKGNPQVGYAIRGSTLKRVLLPDTLTIIGENAFRETGLEEIVIPQNVTIIKSGAFQDCDYLTRAVIRSGIVNNEVFRGCDRMTSVTAEAGVVFSGDSIFRDCPLLETAVIPAATTDVPNDTFRECHRLSSVSLHSGIISIGNSAFCKCLYLPGSGFNFALLTNLEEIKDSAFEECESLDCTLAGCSSLRYIRPNAFKKCAAVRSMAIPNSVTEIENSAFRECVEMQSLTIGTGVQYIRYDAFCGCTQLSSVTINANSIAAMEHPFRDCQNLTSFGPSTGNYTIKVTWDSDIPDDAFSETQSLTTVVIPSGVTTIGESAFRDCRSLTSVTIPSSVTQIKANAFAGCTALNSVTFQGSKSNISIDGSAFNDVPASNVH